MTTPSAGNPSIDRRTAVATFGGLGLAAIASPAFGADDKPAATTLDLLGFDKAKGEFVLPKLPYDYKALEPHLDAQTIEIHHSKHHQAYVTGLNKAAAELAKARDSGDLALVKHWSRELAFHGGGHINHALFWITMAPAGQGGGGKPEGPLADAINRDFGSFDKFAAHFSAAAAAVEGSGWAWLVFDRLSGRLMVQQMEKQQNMLLTGAAPLLGIDVWEHAYYLKFQNKRADYIKAWWNVVNWPKVAALFVAANHA